MTREQFFAWADTLLLPGIGAALPLSTIYEGVVLDAPQPAAAGG